jgi:hypothetical protein
MDWARDQLGKLIHASERGLLSYGFICPTCGEPVRRRAGQERRAHFAHYSYSAKPECEFYHPPSGSVIAGPGRVSGYPQSFPSSPLIQGGLYLERTESSDYSLYLKLPQLWANTASIEEIEIRSGFGIRVYTGAQLERPRYVRVMPTLPLAEAIGSGDLAMLAVIIKLDISRFRESNNLFHANEESGRLLAPDEPIEWGERYRLLRQNALGSPPTGSRAEIELGALRSGWYYYEIGLPTFDQVGDKSQRDATSQFLERTIIAPRGRVYFVDPPAHHVEPDGTYVFPETTERIILRQTGGRPTSITISTGDRSAAKVSDINNDWCEISGLDRGDFAIYVDGREALLGRIDECELFHPFGVRMSVGGRTWEIFEAALHSTLVTEFDETVQVDCPSVRVAEYLAIENSRAILNGCTLILSGTDRQLAFNGNNFGVVASAAADTSEMVSAFTDPHERVRRLWIEGIVARNNGLKGVLWLRAHWNDQTPPIILGTTLDTITSLQPHIQVARGQ